MELSKKDYILNNLSTSTPVLEGGRGTTRVTGEYDPSLLFLFGEGNRSIDAALPATSIQSSNRPSAVCSFLIFEDREVAPAQPAKSSITLKPQRAYTDETRFDSYVISVLTEIYNECPHLNYKTVEYILNKTGLTKKQIWNWFASKRWREKVKKLKEESIPFKDRGNHIKRRRIPFSVGSRNEFIGETESSIASSRRVLSPSDLSPDLYSSGYSNTRHRFCAADQIKLEELYKKSSMIRYDEVTSIALNLGCKEAHVYGWFKTRRSKDRRVARSKKGDFGVEDVRSANVTLNKPEKPFTGSQVKSTGTVASAALGAPPLSAGQEENMIAPVSPARRADAELLLSFSLSGFVPSD